MSRTGQWAINEMIAAWKIIVPLYVPPCLEFKEPPKTDILEINENSDRSFDRISAHDFSGLAATVSDKMIATDDFKKFAAVSDADIIAFVHGLKINFPGLPEFQSGFSLLKPAADETELAFAKRKLATLRVPLLPSDNPANQLINEWHESIRIETNKYDQILAETAYFFDSQNDRLIIRHTPWDTTSENKENYNQWLCDARLRIIQNEVITEVPILIENVIPMIIPGTAADFTNSLPFSFLHISTDSRHIILGFYSEKYVNATSLVNKFSISVILDPRKAFTEYLGVKNFLEYLGYTNPNYKTLNAQPRFNNIDCGRHVTVMATAAVKILTESEKTAIALVPEDLAQFRQVFVVANCTPSDVRKLLEELSNISYRPDFSIEIGGWVAALKNGAQALSQMSFLNSKRLLSPTTQHVVAPKNPAF